MSPLSCCEEFYCPAETSCSCRPRKCYAIKLIIRSRKMRSFSIQFLKHWPAAGAQMKSDFMSWPEVTGVFQISWWPQMKRMKSQLIILRRTRKMCLKPFHQPVQEAFRGFQVFGLDLCMYVFYMTCYSIWSRGVMQRFQYSHWMLNPNLTSLLVHKEHMLIPHNTDTSYICMYMTMIMHDELYCGETCEPPCCRKIIAH